MANKTSITLSVTIKRLVAGASIIGYGSANAFEAGVKLAAGIGKSTPGLKAAGKEYQVGYVAAYLEARETAKARRNIDRDARIEEARTICERPGATSTAADRRTTLQEKACAAARVSWTGCKERAGVKAEATNRKPRATKGNVKTLPVKVSADPKNLPVAKAANDVHGFLAQQGAMMLAYVNKNAKLASNADKSAVADFLAALKKGGAE